MSKWECSGVDGGFTSGDRVPIGRLGGVLSDQIHWTASCLLVKVSSGRLAVVTAAHVLDDVATSSLLAVSSSAQTDEMDIAIDTKDWVFLPEADLATAFIDHSLVHPWVTFCDPLLATATPAIDGLDGEDLEICTLPRPLPGGSESMHRVNAPMAANDWYNSAFPNEIVLPFSPAEGQSGSPVFVKVNGVIHLVGLITSAITAPDSDSMCSVASGTYLMQQLKSLAHV